MNAEMAANPLVPDNAVGGGDGGEGNKDLQESTPLPPSLTLGDLPDTVLENIFKMLPDRERGRLARTCRRMNSIMDSASLWFDASVHLKCDGEMTKKEICQIQANQTFMLKYQEDFRNVEVVMRSLLPSASAILTLRRFAERGVLKRVKVLVHDPEDMCYFLYDSTEESAIWLDNFECRCCGGILKAKCSERFYDLSPRGNIDWMCDCREPVPHSPDEAVQMRNLLTTSTHVTLQLDGDPSKVHHALKILYQFCHSQRSRKCQLVDRLVLPEIWHEVDVPGLNRHRRISPTTGLVTQFPSLQEICVSFHNVSKNLLRELSSRKRTPLKKLVLLHKDYRTTIDQGRRFPSVSGPAWRQLTSACPELTVECRLRVSSEPFPPLTGIIKAETPLARLEVTVEKEEMKGSEAVRSMEELCEEHRCSFLLLVGGRGDERDGEEEEEW